jgi:hypothetical protein
MHAYLLPPPLQRVTFAWHLYSIALYQYWLYQFHFGKAKSLYFAPLNHFDPMKKIIFTFAALCPLLVLGQGYQVNLQGQKQIAMGHTGTALKLDAASVFFNPGAVSMLEHNSIIVGISPIFANSAFRSGTTGQTFRTDNPWARPLRCTACGGPTRAGSRPGWGYTHPSAAA